MINPEKLSLIIGGCVRKEKRDMEQLYHLSHNKLLNIPIRYTSNLEDAKWYFNLGMLRVYDNLKKFDVSRAYFPWAGTIILRSCIDQLRSSNSLRSDDRIIGLEQSPIDIQELNAILDVHESEEIIHQLRILSPKQRTVFSLFVIDEYSHKEIQELTGININTSKWLLSKAKDLLKTNLSLTLNRRNNNAV